MPKQKQPTENVWVAKKPTNFLGWYYLVCAALIGLSWWFVCVYVNLGSPEFNFSGQQKNLITTTATTHSAVVKDTRVPRRLDGVLLEPQKSNLWPYAVMIENLPVTRPQSGLSQASIVYETLAEGGSTRFMALFDPDIKIPILMPVRSSRPYYLEWLSEYHALYVHAGGSPKALAMIRDNPDIVNLNTLSRDSGYFWRDKTIAAPHNLVISSDKIFLALNAKKLWDQVPSFRSWLFKDEAALADRGADGKTINFNFSYGKSFKVAYKYDQANNVYWRYNSDQPHLDKNTGQQISAKNVIVQLVPQPTIDGEKGRLAIKVEGNGKAWIYRDGQVIEGTWQKNSRTDRTIFSDANGQEVQLNRGNTWVHVLPVNQAVTYE